ncbi:MAG: hypothetical protein OHK0022_25560 [Roseiflexaceae bacterium]
MEDLWPDDISFNAIKAPVAILKEQAALLGKKTNKIVTAKITRRTNETFKPFMYTFHLVAPALQNYHYRLFSIGHDINLYPVTFHIDTDIRKELHPGKEPFEFTAENEDDFISLLRQILKSKKTKFIIESILAQSLGFDKEERLAS